MFTFAWIPYLFACFWKFKSWNIIILAFPRRKQSTVFMSYIAPALCIEKKEMTSLHKFMQDKLQKQTRGSAFQNNLYWKILQTTCENNFVQSLFFQGRRLQSCNFIRKIFRHRCSLLVLYSISERLFLHKSSGRRLLKNILSFWTIQETANMNCHIPRGICQLLVICSKRSGIFRNIVLKYCFGTEVTVKPLRSNKGWETLKVYFSNKSLNKSCRPGLITWKPEWGLLAWDFSFFNCNKNNHWLLE